MMSHFNRKIHTGLLRLSPCVDTDGELAELVNLLSKGQYINVVASETLQKCAFQDEKISKCTEEYVRNPISLPEYIETVCQEIVNNFGAVEHSKTYALITAVVFLQIFIEQNFTGPSLPIQESIAPLGFLNAILGKSKSSDFQDTFQRECVTLLSSLGQTAYDLTDSAIFLLLSLRILEMLQESSVSLLNFKGTNQDDSEDILTKSNISTSGKDVIVASIQWWRCRALQIQISLLPEPSSILTSVSTTLLNSSVVSSFIDESNVNTPLNQELLVLYYLESARNGINTGMENLSIASLSKAKNISGLKFLITGCKAVHTKYQTTAKTSLVILAKSNPSMVSADERNQVVPEHLHLNSDILLETPVYEAVGEGASKDEVESEDPQSLLPMATGNTMPVELKSLDPNNQPKLADLDAIQLLLRAFAHKQTSPSGNPLTEMELLAVYRRILQSSNVNWSISAKCLWERSVLESSRAKTIERGVLQMESLVEDLGMHSKTQDSQFALKCLALSDTSNLINQNRLKYIHQLPLAPRWCLDRELAEKLMRLGLVKSAVGIYERLQMWVDAALCYAVSGDENTAEKILADCVSRNPSDGRALYVLGDIREDPTLWERSWECSKYYKAKVALAKYYRNPPKSTGLSPNMRLAVTCLCDALTVNPLHFETWYLYGCYGLECSNFAVSTEAFRRCVALDETSNYAWSNLAASLLQLNKPQEALVALKKAVVIGDSDINAKASWRIWDNYLTVAAKVGEWDDVLLASKKVLSVKKESHGEAAIDVKILEKLSQILIQSEYSETQRLTHFQKSCIDFMCNDVSSVVTSSPQIWKIVASVELWRGKPWEALNCQEKAYRAVSNNPNLDVDSQAWNSAVTTCTDLVDAYQSLGDLPGKHGAGDVVCKDWKVKARSAVQSLMGKGNASWDDTPGYETLSSLKDGLRV